VPSRGRTRQRQLREQPQRSDFEGIDIDATTSLVLGRFRGSIID
jgi:hypothetical protein